MIPLDLFPRSLSPGPTDAARVPRAAPPNVLPFSFLARGTRASPTVHPAHHHRIICTYYVAAMWKKILSSRNGHDFL
ncbi:Uncharacterized protein TCM_005790 [Theobroma cacao]|uniref:Uncharacterized protein n=1 Tax=Theobroma cacao TaxID=3641 RepID=A0A061E2Q8_THECC|nr:Uncharacterized protein TCM_005790 [Theobroma cacao]